jgi:ADP-heptose:LPS heptosyltransferase
MKSNVVNFYDLAVVREIVPLLKLRIKMFGQPLIGQTAGRNLSTLVVMPCVVGDCLSYLPALRAFADRNLAPVDVVVSPDFKALAERIKGVRRVFLASSSYNRASEQHNGSRHSMPSEYDQIIVLRMTRQGFDLIKDVRSKRIVSSDVALLNYVLHLAKSSLLNRPVVQSREMMHEVFGIKDYPKLSNVYDLFDDSVEDLNTIVSLPLINCKARKVLVHTGSGWDVKRWSDEKWIELLKRINRTGDYRFFFVGKGKEEQLSFERIQRSLEFYVHSLIDRLDLWELYQIMKMSDYFIGIDSGPRNLAHFANLRSVTLLNPAAVKNFMPIDKRDITVERPNRVPANIVNISRGASLNRISVDEVCEAFEEMTALSGHRQKAAGPIRETRLSVASYAV